MLISQSESSIQQHCNIIYIHIFFHYVCIYIYSVCICEYKYEYSVDLRVKYEQGIF